MKNTHIPSWAVAAALILRETDGYSHYTRLRKQIMESGLSDLGRDGETPDHTIKTILLTHVSPNGVKLFDSLGDGDYRLENPKYAKTLPEVEEARRRLDEN